MQCKTLKSRHSFSSWRPTQYSSALVRGPWSSAPRSINAPKCVQTTSRETRPTHGTRTVHAAAPHASFSHCILLWDAFLVWQPPLHPHGSITTQSGPKTCVAAMQGIVVAGGLVSRFHVGVFPKPCGLSLGIVHRPEKKGEKSVLVEQAPMGGQGEPTCTPGLKPVAMAHHLIRCEEWAGSLVRPQCTEGFLIFCLKPAMTASIVGVRNRFVSASLWAWLLRNPFPGPSLASPKCSTPRRPRYFLCRARALQCTCRTHARPCLRLWSPGDRVVPGTLDAFPQGGPGGRNASFAARQKYGTCADRTSAGLRAASHSAGNCSFLARVIGTCKGERASSCISCTTPRPEGGCCRMGVFVGSSQPPVTPLGLVGGGHGGFSRSSHAGTPSSHPGCMPQGCGGHASLQMAFPRETRVSPGLGWWGVRSASGGYLGELAQLSGFLACPKSDAYCESGRSKWAGPTIKGVGSQLWAHV